jgi:hypothetical protein
MARESEKTTRETGKAKSEAAAESKSDANDETPDQRSDPSDTVELLKAQHRGLQAILAKRSDANAERQAIVSEFALAWLPQTAVEQEVLVPALQDAGVDEERIAAIGIQKDIINLILADLLRDCDREFAQTKLEALAKQFDALVASADGEGAGLFAAVSTAEKSIPELNSKGVSRTWMKASERP